jgi:DNA-binding protein H-NS
MRDLRTVALEMVEEARALAKEIDEFQSPPSRSQIDAAQERMNRLQRLRNRMQTEADARSDERQAV